MAVRQIASAVPCGVFLVNPFDGICELQANAKLHFTITPGTEGLRLAQRHLDDGKCQCRGVFRYRGARVAPNVGRGGEALSCKVFISTTKEVLVIMTAVTRRLTQRPIEVYGMASMCTVIGIPRSGY